VDPGVDNPHRPRARLGGHIEPCLTSVGQKVEDFRLLGHPQRTRKLHLARLLEICADVPHSSMPFVQVGSKVRFSRGGRFPKLALLPLGTRRQTGMAARTRCSDIRLVQLPQSAKQR